MNPNAVLSKELYVKPLKENEVVVYKLCATDEIDYSRMEIDPNGNDTGRFRKKSPGWITSDRYTVYDPKLGRRVIIGNVVSLKQEIMPDRSTKDIPVLGRVKFEMGKAVTLTSKDQNTYEFLERLDQNRDNPFRDKNKPAKFYRVDERRVAEDKNHKNLVLADALMWIGSADQTEIKTINAGLPPGMKLNMNDPYEVIKSQLFDLTKDNPIMVMKASNNTKVKIKIQVMDASKFEVIFFEDEKREWIFNRGERAKIMSVDIGKNKVDALVEFFQSSEGVKFYRGMVSEMKTFLKSGAPEVV